MALRDWIFLLAALGNLALALSSVTRSGKSPLALPLALVAFDFFGFTAATFCNHVVGGPLWRPLDVTFTALGPAFVLHFVLVFVGEIRARKKILFIAYSGFGALALASAPAFFGAWSLVDSPTWSFAFLLGWLPTLGLEIVVLLRHLRATQEIDEQARTRLILAAIAVGSLFAATDVVRDFGIAIPSLTPVGALWSASLMAVVALRFRLFGKNLGYLTSLYALSVAASAVLLYLTLFQGLKSELPALTFGVTVVTLALAAIVREASSSVSTYRERVERLAVLGRFSAQMSHDLKNPLAALVGAVQVLEADVDDPAKFRALIVEQAARIRTIVDKYDRLGRIDPVRRPTSLHELVKRVAGLQTHATPNAVAITLDLAPDADVAELDADLVAGVIENLLRNAFEAMPDGGEIVVRSRREAGSGDLILSVIDTGCGMDARQAERAFDDFYTTKSTGSGHGLAFVRRVALAHGGDASLRSTEGRGTQVDVRFR